MKCVSALLIWLKYKLFIEEKTLGTWRVQKQMANERHWITVAWSFLKEQFYNYLLIKCGKGSKREQIVKLLKKNVLNPVGGKDWSQWCKSQGKKLEK